MRMVFGDLIPPSGLRVLYRVPLSDLQGSFKGSTGFRVPKSPMYYTLNYRGRNGIYKGLYKRSIREFRNIPLNHRGLNIVI